MFTTLLEKLSIPKQMYILSGLGTLAIIAVSVSHQFGSLSNTVQIIIAAVGIVGSVFGAIIMGNHTARRTEKIIAAYNALAEGDLTKKCAIPGKDEFAWMAWEYSNTRKKFSAIVNDIYEHAATLANSAEQLAKVTETTKRGVSTQNSQIEQVAAAMNQMSATIQEIARNASDAAESATNADREAANGNRVMNDTIGSIDGLAQEVDRTFDFITKLKQESDGIGAVLDVIRGIAEQTNLLALNAAIEAARAGEQGRGFAVVADEVRTLASRTQESTQEIQDMIEKLQAGTNEAVSVMEQGKKRAEISVGQSAEAGNALDTIVSVVDKIKETNTQIATAAEQQSATSEEINSNVNTISNISADTANNAMQTAQSSEDLAKLAVELQNLVNNFKVA